MVLGRMKYTTALVLLVSVTLWVGAAATCETAQTLLGQMVPWPMMSTGIAGRGLEIDRAPDEALTLPDLPPSVRFGLMALGHGSDPGVSCAVCNQLDGPPLLLVDANNNEDLTNNL